VPARYRCYGRFPHGSRPFSPPGAAFTALSQASDDQPSRGAPAGSPALALRDVARTLGLTPQAVRRARVQLPVLAALFAGVILVWEYRTSVFGLPSCSGCVSPDSGTTTLRVFVVIALVILGWALARDLGRGLGTVLFRRMDAASAGTAGFLMRLGGLAIALLAALGIADVSITAIAIGASASAVVIGLAAQQTLGNLIAGIVLLSARPFRVGDTVRLQVGVLAGQIEGVVTSLGLMYTTFDSSGDPVLVPNSAVLAAAIRPLREPKAVSLRARVRDGRTPLELQQAIEEQLTIPIRRRPRVALEEIDDASIVVTITVAPENPGQASLLASELLEVVTREVGADVSAPGGQEDGEAAAAPERLT
jgi:small conductance mechanosensitive channel